jgi:hypothetical protein
LRYEVFLWAALIAVVIAARLVHRRCQREEVTATMLLFTLPMGYALGAWSLFNWLIVGSPLYWLKQQANGNISIGRGDRGAQAIPRIPIGTIASEVLSLNWHIFPFGALVVCALVVLLAYRRDGMTAALLGCVTLNAALTGLLIWTARDRSLLQLRYNMRAMPLSILAFAWILYCLRGWARTATAIVGIAVLLASIAVSWRTMRTYPYEFGEAAMTSAIQGRSQEGVRSDGYLFGIDPERQTARYIVSLHTGRESVLTDDAQTFGVMLFSDPRDYLDRIAISDAKWKKVLQDPWGKVSHILVSRFGSPDLIRECYPNIANAGAPGLTIVYSNAKYVVLTVQPTMPDIVRQRLSEAGPHASPCAA